MSTKGTIYLLFPSPRSTLFPALIKYLGLDVKISDRDDPSYKAAFPLNKAPAYLAADGWKLHEAMAILEYFISQKPKSCTYPFYGTNEREKAEVWQWVSFANSDCVNSLGAMLHGPPQIRAQSKITAWKCLDEFEDQLKKSPFLVGKNITLADIYSAILFAGGIEGGMFDKAFFKSHPASAKWFRKVADTDPILSPTLKGKAPKN